LAGQSKKGRSKSYGRSGKPILQKAARVGMGLGLEWKQQKAKRYRQRGSMVISKPGRKKF